MSAYEYYDIALGHLSNVIAIISLYIAISSGYAALAYTVSARLTQSQVIVLSAVYTVWNIILIVAGDSAVSNGIARWKSAAEILGEPFEIMMSYPVSVFFLIFFLLLISSQWFMWSVGHPKVQ